MPSIKCKCNEVLSFNEIPNPNEWLTISDVKYDGYHGAVDSEKLYSDMTSFIKCPNCKRLWFFWNGFDSKPISYVAE